MKKTYSGASMISDQQGHGLTRTRSTVTTRMKMLESKLVDGGEIENRRERKLFEKMKKQQEKKMNKGVNQ